MQRNVSEGSDLETVSSAHFENLVCKEVVNEQPNAIQRQRIGRALDLLCVVPADNPRNYPKSIPDRGLERRLRLTDVVTAGRR